jgi:hypothetical protein
MKIAVDTHGHKMMLNVTDNVGILLTEIATAQLYHQDYVNNKYQWKRCGTKEEPLPVGIEFIEETQLNEATPAIDALSASLKESQKNWIEYYNKYNAAERELKELKAKIEVLSPKKEKTE